MIAYQDRAVLLLEDCKLVDSLAVLMGLHNVSKLGLHIRGATHTLQGGTSLHSHA